MASSSSQAPRRIPGAPPNIFLEGAGFSYNTDPAPPPPPPTVLDDDPWGDWGSFSVKKKKKKRVVQTEWSFDVLGKGKEKETEDSLTSPYGDEELPVFGKPFGFRSKKNDRSSPTADQAGSSAKRAARKKTLNPYEDLLVEADNDLDLYAEGKGKLKLITIGKPSRYVLGVENGFTNILTSTSTPRENVNDASSESKIDSSSWRDDIQEETPPFPPSSNPPTSCVVCMEDFTPRTRPPAWISLACMHEPAVCSTCIATSIKSDLDSKMWNKIQCPECGTLLIYDDVRRLADAITFARYVCCHLFLPSFISVSHHLERRMQRLTYSKLRSPLLPFRALQGPQLRLVPQMHLWPTARERLRLAHRPLSKLQ